MTDFTDYRYDAPRVSSAGGDSGYAALADEWMELVGFPQRPEQVLFQRPAEAGMNETDLATFYRGVISRFGSNGRLTNEQVRDALCNPNLSLDEAAGLRALQWWAGYHSIPGRTINAAHINAVATALETSAAGRPLTTTQRADADDLMLMNRAYRRDFAALNMNLYANAANPLLSIVPEAAVQPIGVGNCHFVAAISSMAAVNPGMIRNMIADNRNGTYTVTFPGMDPITVNAPTRAEILMYGQSTEHGIWPTVLMAAYGRYWTPNGTRNLEGAGGSRRHDGLRTMTGGGIDADDNFWTSYATLHDSLRDAFNERRPITAVIANEFFATFGLSDNREDNTGLACGHAYSIIGFQPNPGNHQQATVTLRNPWGTANWFNGRPPAGITDLGNGSFRMSLYDFNRIFTGAVYSTATPR